MIDFKPAARLLVVALLLAPVPAPAQRFLGGPPGERTYASVASNCTAGNVGGVEAISDANTGAPNATITAGGGSNHVFAACLVAAGPTYVWTVITVNGASSYATASDLWAGTSVVAVVTPKSIADSGAFQGLTDGASITWNVASGNNATLTLTASGHTLSNPTGNVVPGGNYDIIINPGATPYTMSWGTAYDFGAAGPPTLTASKNNWISCKAIASSGANSLYCAYGLGF